MTHLINDINKLALETAEVLFVFPEIAIESPVNTPNKVNIWGKFINISVDFDLYSGEDASPEQIKRLNEFYKHPKLLADKKHITEYCISNNNAEKCDNVFKYVTPRRILVPRSDSSKSIILLCDSKFDIEHGLAVVFKNNKFVDIVPQDDVI